MTDYPELPSFLIDPIIQNALSEDLGQLGDVTSRAVIPVGTQTTAKLVARQDGVVSGLQVAKRAFILIDENLVVTFHMSDGDACHAGAVMMTVSGSAISILSAERVALNFLGRLSGIASKTAAFVAQTVGTTARITCTRKTTPGLRLLEKQAVLDGGGSNHRFGLGDAMLIKDNHIAAAGGITAVLTRARAQASHMMRIEIEVDTLPQLDEVLAVGGADVVLLDNMATADLVRAVDKVEGRLITEASGNMSLPRIAEVAATGVQYISVGALTHSIENMDIGLDI
jgi:nicotinate-nucleotide pyrophosphorylase (carboxylating)